MTRARRILTTPIEYPLWFIAFITAMWIWAAWPAYFIWLGLGVGLVWGVGQNVIARRRARGSA
jgi:hypothetical protein